ncbi:MAG: sulfite exporter TauE/SafE family protein [Actinomycetota bacterium]|nr:sulfite exporter TauE/SafE family protein [Actinomycetota bacterium]
MTHLAAWPVIVLAGLGVGVSMGLFGVGGSSVATPLLALLGAPGLIAVASPLPATIPSAALGAVPYLRSREARTRAAAWSVLGGIPGTVAGALLSRLAGGPVLLVLSGVVLIVIGARVVRPIGESTRQEGTRRRQNRLLLAASAAAVGVFTGLLANGGAFLLVPLYLLVFGLRMRQAVGTSLLVITVLAIPTLVTHWALGHIDWMLAGEFAAGLIPGAVAGSLLAHKINGPAIRRSFGVFLMVFGTAFTAYQIGTGRG